MRLQLAVFCALIPGCAIPRTDFMERVLGPSNSSRAFDEAISPVRDQVLRNEWHEPYRLSFEGARKVVLKDGNEGAVALLRGRGAPCGTGLTLGGVTADPGAIDAGLQGIVMLTADGRPSDLVVNSRASMTVADLDGDGWADSLVRWESSFDNCRPPFLIIHDLRRPGLPAMVSIQFNASAASTLQLVPFFHEEEELKLIKGRWRFDETPAGFPEIIIEVVVDELVSRVARFRYDSSMDQWVEPDPDPEGFWSRNPDVWRGATLEVASIRVR